LPVHVVCPHETTKCGHSVSIRERDKKLLGSLSARNALGCEVRPS
jgi:hypothetical protein